MATEQSNTQVFSSTVRWIKRLFGSDQIETTLRDRILFGIGLAVTLGFAGFPIYIMVVTSFMPVTEIYSLPPVSIPYPSELTLGQYQTLFTRLNFVQNIINSFIISVVMATLSIIVAVPGAYSFARLDYPGQTLISQGVLVVYMFSGILLVVPLYQIVAFLNLIDTLFSLIFTYLVYGLPLSLWLLGSYFKGIPPEIEEAAMMDGYSRLEVIARVTLPMSIPAIIAVFLYTFLIAWNEYLFASVFLKSTGNFTIPIAITQLSASAVVDSVWGVIMAASVIASIPVIIMFFYMEQYLSEVSLAGR